MGRMERKPGQIVKNPPERAFVAASSEPAGSGPAREGPRRPPRPVSAAWLERVALHYLDRYSASTEMLRRTLARRVEKRARACDEDPAAFAEMVEETVARALRAGLVDDARFAQARLATLRRRGTSTRGAGAKLAAKGVPRAVVDAAMEGEREALSEAAGEEGDVEARAAAAYARRRRLGPHRTAETRAHHRDRDLAAMARAGFGYRLARSVIEAEGAAEPGEGPAAT